MTEPSAWARQRFDWLDQVCSDFELPPICFRLAYIISRYVNRETDDAWPPQQILIAKLGKCERTVRDALASLEKRGHLVITDGRGRGSRYSPVFANRQEPAALVEAEPAENCRFENETGSFSPANRQEPAGKTSEKLPVKPAENCRSLYIESPNIESPKHETRKNEIRESEIALSGQSPNRDKLSKAATDEAFADFWRHFPHHGRRQTEAKEKFTSILKSGRATAADVIAGAARYAAECASHNRDPEYITRPHNWPSKAGWLDVPVAAAAETSQSKRSQKPTSLELTLARINQHREGGK